jgi:2-polyprenyl-3-methyl-5-hydroxy-6-metoxy-1,4-benzoquinol methylase
MLETKDYNKIYDTEEEYKQNYLQSQYFPIWEQLTKFLTSEDRILEIGCGTGQFAHYLEDLGFTDYRGFDSSDRAIQIAKERCSQIFFVGDAYNYSNYRSYYNTIIITEILEHLEDDEMIFTNIKKGTKFLFSLPTFKCKGHLRSFPNRKSIVERYGTFISFKKIFQYEHWFYGMGVVR